VPQVAGEDIAMKRTFYVIATALSLTALTSPEAVSQEGHERDQVCVYEHADYGGWEQCYGAGEDVRDLGNRRNSISSVRIRGRAEITLYQHPDFQGREVSIDSSTPDLRQIARFWNDETDSLRVSTADFGGRHRGGRREDRVCVYEHVNYQGHSQCWDSGEEIDDLQSIGWNDGISSVRVFGGTRVAFYEHSEFDGQRLIVDHDIPDLTQVRAGGNSNWNDRISSVRVGEDRSRRPGRRD
jgi:hypothetical protein